MRTLFTTSAVHPRSRFDLWHEVACKTIIGHDSRPKDRLRFEANLRHAALDDIDLVLFEAAPMGAARTARNIADTPNGSLLICRQVRGDAGLEQAGRQTLLAPGEMTLLDPQRPYTAQFKEPVQMLVLKLPRRALEARFGLTEDFTVLKLRPDDPVVALTSAHLAMLPGCAEIDDAAAAAIARYTLDLIGLSLSATTYGAKPARSAARSLAASNLRAFVDTRLSDPAMDPAMAAAGAGISVRYANALLAEEGTSLNRLIQTRRLDQCTRSLADPAQCRRTVSDIAFGWGFSDLTHFGRLFKKRFGRTPREYRRERLVGEDADTRRPIAGRPPRTPQLTRP